LGFIVWQPKAPDLKDVMYVLPMPTALCELQLYMTEAVSIVEWDGLQ